MREVIPAKKITKGSQTAGSEEEGREARKVQRETSFFLHGEGEKKKTERAWCSSFRQGARTIQLHPRQGPTIRPKNRRWHQFRNSRN